jgi:death on curing protein
MSCNYLTLEEILRLHYQLIEDFGGSHGVRDEGRLKSVIDAPKQSVFGEEQYPTVLHKAAVYLRNIVGDHPFSDGNKRTAITVCGIFLTRNGYELIATPDLLEDFTVKVATDHLDIDTIVAWLKTHTTLR